jgi:hypothetical protein
MFDRSLARASTLFGAFVGGWLAIIAPNAHATAPTITGAPVTAVVPNIGASVAINLRDLGVVRGAGPLFIDPDSLQLLMNGQTVGGLFASFFPNNGPGRVCIVLVNQDFTVPTGQTFALRIAVSNQTGASVGPVTVPITNTPGNVINTPAEQAACDEPNDAPIANAGSDRTISDMDGQAGENVTLDASGSSDPDPDNTLTYRWFEGQTRTPIAGPSTTPTAVVNLAPGTHTITLQVTDDSGDVEIGVDEDDLQITVNAPAIPTANAGPDRNIPDSDGEPGESVTLDGSGSTDTDGTLASSQARR